MKCPKCQFENREGAKFCSECGHKFELTCPDCGATNRAGAKFCDECGHNLILPSTPLPKDLSFSEKLDKIQRYLPKGLTDKILSQRDKIEGERKQVTVMFCDMEGFTALSEKLGPEEAYTVMDRVYELLIHKVHDYDGTVNEMTGDGIMALFGAPIALEDAPQRAIRSALGIHREMVKFSDTLKRERRGIPPLKMRIGIHSGPVVVGTLGNDLRVEFKAVGDTVNLASRMEGLAEGGTTYVTQEIFKLTEGLFRFEALGEKKVKGKEDPIETYRVIAPSTRKTRFDVSAERGLTPFLGRERELELLLDGFARAKGARGQAFSIISEAGLGKSRLLYEFRKAVANEDVTFLEGKCLSYSRGVPYYPIIDVLKSNFEIGEDASDNEIRERVEKRLQILGTDEASTLPYLLELLSVKESGIEKISMSPEARKGRIIEALKRIVIKGSEIRPHIIALEDLHWIDKSSEEALKDVLDSISGARVFLIFTYRPEFVHTWGGRSYHSQITLNRLSNSESLLMASHLLGTEDMESDLEELILQKTEGVPFFIEEFIESLKDLKIVERKENKYHLTRDIQDLSIPSTIQDVIMARVDSLPDGAKEVLQTGSVIEREFNFKLLERVMDLSQQQLLSSVSALKDSELVFERGIYPHSAYIFKHTLTREVVYDSILSRRKKGLHQKIGEAIEELYRENIDQYYGVLSEHFISSENYEKGAEYSMLARKKAAKAGSLTDAIEYAKKRVLCLESLPQTDVNQRKIIDARTALSGYYTSLTYLVEAKDAVMPIVDLARELNYQRALPGIYASIGLHSLWAEEDYSKGFQYLNNALKISKEEEDYIYYYFSNFFLGVASVWWNCEFEKAFGYFKESIDLSGSANDLIGGSIAKGFSSINYCFQGEIDLAYELTRESLQMATESGDIYVKGGAYSSYGTCCYFKGAYEEAEENLIKGLDFCEKSAQVALGALCSGWLGFVHSDLGENEKAEDDYKRAIGILESAKILPSWINMWRLCITRSKVLNHDLDIELNDLSKSNEGNNFRVIEGWVARFIGEILLNFDEQHMGEAEDWIKRAIEADKRNGTMWSLAGNYALYSEMFRRKRNRSKAKENLSKALEIFKECGADGWVGKYEKELAALS